MSLRPELRPRGSSTCLKAELLRPKGSAERKGKARLLGAGGGRAQRPVTQIILPSIIFVNPLSNFGGGGLPSYPVPLAATRTDQHNFVMVIFTLERNVKTAFIPALIADVRLLVDVFFDHLFHDCEPLASKLKRLMMDSWLPL